MRRLHWPVPPAAVQQRMQVARPPRPPRPPPPPPRLRGERWPSALSSLPTPSPRASSARSGGLGYGLGCVLWSRVQGPRSRSYGLGCVLWFMVWVMVWDVSYGPHSGAAPAGPGAAARTAHAVRRGRQALQRALSSSESGPASDPVAWASHPPAPAPAAPDAAGSAPPGDRPETESPRLPPQRRASDETCPVSTEGGTRRVQLVREGGGRGRASDGDALAPHPPNRPLSARAPVPKAGRPHSARPPRPVSAAPRRTPGV
jgi:hypothetical protein